MSIEEKAKAYDEALERAKELIAKWTGKNKDFYVEDYSYIFPELRESEDERMRKAILAAIRQGLDTEKALAKYNVTYDDVEAWLEKQKINTEGDFSRGYDCGYQAGYAIAMNEMKPKVATATLDSEKQKEPKPVDDSFKTKLAEYLTKNHTGGSYSISSESILEMAKEELIRRGELKEQKPELVQHPPITYTYPSDASRDERLKAALLALLNSDLLKVKEGGYFTKQDLIDWVKKQKEQKPSTSIYWHAIKKGEKLPCRAYIWNPNYEKYHDCWEGKLIPNVENIRVGADTWYLPAKDVRDLPREGVDELPEEQKPDLPAGFYVTLPDGKQYYAKEMRCNGMNIKVVEPKPSWNPSEVVEGEVSAVILHKNGDEVHYAVTYPEGERPHSITDKVRMIICKKED